jgi:putative flippase GtrA
MRNKLLSFWNNHPEWHKDAGRIVRFGVTGALSTGLHYCAYLLALLVFNATLSYTIGYGVGLIFNYFMTTRFTFKEQATKKNAAGFLGSHIINYLLEIGLLNLLMYFGVGKALAGIMTLVMIVPVNFLLLRFVFVKLK